MASLTDAQARLFLEPNFGVVATIRADGGPQTSVVWVDYDGENVVFNTTRGRAKGRNLLANPRVSITVWDRDDPYRYVEVEGEATLDDAGADVHIERLAQQYWGRSYDDPSDRVIVRVRPDRVHAHRVA